MASTSLQHCCLLVVKLLHSHIVGVVVKNHWEICRLTCKKMLKRDIIDKKVTQNYFNLDKVVNLLEILLKTFLNWPWIALTDSNWLKAISLHRKLEFWRFCYIINCYEVWFFRVQRSKKYLLLQFLLLIVPNLKIWWTDMSNFGIRN